MGDTDECTRPSWDVADGIASSDDGPDGRRFILESDLIAGFPDEAVGDTDGVGHRMFSHPVASCEAGGCTAYGGDNLHSRWGCSPER